MILYDSEAFFYRNAFVETFIDTNSSYYKSYIMLPKTTGSPFYDGYLWDCFYNSHRISLSYALDYVQSINTNIYVFGDKNKNLDANISGSLDGCYDSVLIVSAKDIDNIILTLPDDCYFFDDSLSWAIALTHEETKPGRRYCLFAEPQTSSQN